MPDFILKLRAAVEGLTYPSESDEPFTVFTWPASRGSARGAVAAQVKSNSISEQGIGTFFAELVEDDQAKRFDALQKVLTANLSGVCVFKFTRGSQKDIYVIGRVESGEWAGVKTMSVET